MADAVVGNDDDVEMTMVVTNCGGNPVQLEAGEVLGAVLLLREKVGSIDIQTVGTWQTNYDGKTTEVDRQRTSQVASIQSMSG